MPQLWHTLYVTKVEYKRRSKNVWSSGSMLVFVFAHLYQLSNLKCHLFSEQEGSELCISIVKLLI
jgi:hypothetical protein